MPLTFAVGSLPVRGTRGTFFSGRKTKDLSPAESACLLCVEDGQSQQLCHIVQCSVSCCAVDVPSLITVGEWHRLQSEYTKVPLWHFRLEQERRGGGAGEQQRGRQRRKENLAARMSATPSSRSFAT